MTDAPEDFLDGAGDVVPLRQARPQPKRRFPLVAFDDVQMTTTGLYLVKRLIPREGLVIVWGAPKCGKSFWVFDLVMHVALGWEYRGMRVTAGKVVYVACEGERGLGARIEAFRRARLTEHSGAVPFHLLTTQLDLAAEAGSLIGDIQAQAGNDVSAIVIDTLNRSLSGSESSDEDMGAYVKAADAVRAAFGCAVIVIHHCGLDDTRPRGHTSLAGAADAQISVKRDAAEAVVAKVELMKDGATDVEIRSTLRVVELGQDEDGDPVTSCVIEPVSGEAPRPVTRRKVPPSAQAAFDLLRKAVETEGELPPASNHIPPHARAVKREQWRRYCYAGLVSGAENADAKRKAFNRSASKLENAGVIKSWDEWVWIP